MDVEIIIPFYHAGDESLARLRKTLQWLSLQQGANVGIHVVANPIAVSKSFQNEFARVKFSNTEKKGVNGARNLGLRGAQGEILFFLDDDIELESADFCAKLKDFFGAHPQWDGVTVQVEAAPTADRWDRAYGDLLLDWLEQGLHADGSCRFAAAGAMAFRRASLQGIFFDEGIVFGGAEGSFLAALYEKRKRLCWQPSFRAFHHSNLSFRQYARRAFLQGRQAAREKRGGSARLGWTLKERQSVSPPHELEWYRLFYDLGRWWAKKSDVSLWMPLWKRLWSLSPGGNLSSCWQEFQRLKSLFWRRSRFFN